MKQRLRKAINKKHGNLINRVKRESFLVQDGTYTLTQYLRLNRLYFRINIG